MTKLLHEATATPTSTKRGLWRALLITPGVGSSGNWLEETIRRDGPRALRKGARCFVTHNREENGEPNPFMMWGVLDSDSFYSEEEGGLVADIQVLNSWIDRVEEVAPHTALSVYLMGESDEFGNITAILDDVQNGVDMVVYPGREGSGLVEKLYESARMESQKNSPVKKAEETDTKGLSEMELKDVSDKVDALEAKIDAALASKQAEATAEANDEAIAAAVKEALDKQAEAISASLELVEAAKDDLLPSQVTSLRESAIKGEDITASVESSKKIAAEAKAAFGNKNDGETGRLGESASTEGYVLGGFATSKKGA
ncbi:capsid maturation protease [Microbacterium phage Jacko]|nr:capsid maturation protease [Microbacterium phage Jacko]